MDAASALLKKPPSHLDFSKIICLSFFFERRVVSFPQQNQWTFKIDNILQLIAIKYFNRLTELLIHFKTYRGADLQSNAFITICIFKEESDFLNLSPDPPCKHTQTG